MPRNSDSKFMFADREDAAHQLLEAIPVEHFRERDVTVLALSEGGVILADVVAHALEAPMDILLTEAVPAPKNPDLPIAMVSETKAMVMHRALIEAFGIDEDYVYNEGERRYEDQLLAKVYRYRQGALMPDVAHRVVLLVDECAETGITILAAIKSMIEQNAKNVYLAVPILDAEVRDNLTPVCDGVYCPHTIRDYVSIEYYYENTEPPTEETIKRILKAHE